MSGATPAPARPGFDKAILPSRHVTEGVQQSPSRVFLYGMGLSDEEIAQPFAGVAAAWHDGAAAGDLPAQLAEAAKDGLTGAGVTPRGFATVGDAHTAAGVPATALLLRELVADSVELTVRGHAYDALVLVGATDRTIAGLLLGALRLDVPAVLVPVVGPVAGSRPCDLAMAAVAERLGFVVAGHAEPARTPAELVVRARDAGRVLADRLAVGRTARAGVTPEALRSAAEVASSSLPALLVHLLAVASEAGVDVDAASLAAAGGGTVVGGGLAPDGALVARPAAELVRGPAAVFADVAAAERALRSGRVVHGSVLVVRGQGPRGGPGLPVVAPDPSLLIEHGVPLVVSDGRVVVPSLVASASCVGPEAAADGPLARLRDGDEVTLTADALDATPTGDDRSPAGQAPPAGGSVAAKYTRFVGPALAGATTHPGAKRERVRYPDL